MDPAEDLRDRRDALAARSGDEAAFARLVERHARRVHDLARRMLRDPNEAEDVVQHAFWNVWRARNRYDPGRPFVPWLVRIAANLAKNRLASRARRREVARGGEEGPPDPPAPPPPPVADPLAARLDHLLDDLPEPYRLAMVLRYRLDLSLEAIAEVTGELVATVKTHLHRGRAALRARLGPPAETRPGSGGTGG